MEKDDMRQNGDGMKWRWGKVDIGWNDDEDQYGMGRNEKDMEQNVDEEKMIWNEMMIEIKMIQEDQNDMEQED